MNAVFRSVVLDGSEKNDGFYLKEISIGQLCSADAGEGYAYPGGGSKMVCEVEGANKSHF